MVYMTEALFKLLGCIFCAMLFNFLILILLDKLITSKKYRLDGVKLYIEIGEQTKNAEMAIRELSFVAANYRDNGNAVETVIVDNGMKKEEREVCELLSKDYDFIKLKNKCEIFK